MSARFQAVYNGYVTDECGGLILSFRADGNNRAAARRAAQWARERDKELAVEIKPYREKRSLSANAYFHVLVNAIAGKLDIGEQEAKRQLVLDYGTLMRDDTGTVVGLKLPKSVDIYAVYPYAKQFDERTENGKAFIRYILYKRTHTLDTAEMSRLIRGTVEEAKNLGIETATPEEISRMLSLHKTEE